MRVRLSVNDPFIVGSAKLRPREKRSLERSFTLEIESLKLGDGEVFHGEVFHGEVFHGEGILAVTGALLQSGVSCVWGCQGALSGEAAALDAVLRGEDAPVGVPVPFTPLKRGPARVH